MLFYWFVAHQNKVAAESVVKTLVRCEAKNRFCSWVLVVLVMAEVSQLCMSVKPIISEF